MCNKEKECNCKKCDCSKKWLTLVSKEEDVVIVNEKIKRYKKLGYVA